MAMTTGSEDLGQLLEELGEHSGALPFSKLYVLSDLAGPRLASFQTAFDAYPAAQRRRLVQALVQLAEASFEVNFHAIFRHCLGDSSEEVRAAAIEGLWEDEDVALIGPMLSMLRADPSAQVRAAAASALGRYVLAGELEKIDPPIQVRITAELLTSIHLKGESDAVRRRAIEAVSYSCTPEVFEVLETAYFHEDEEMRLSAIVGMGRTCDRRWIPILLAELESDSPAIRYEAALASGHLMMGEAVPTLAELLDDADAQVRGAAIWALGQIGGDQAKQVLLDALEDTDDDTEVAIEEALAEQALLEGDLDFALYDFDEDSVDDLSDDTLYPLWSADDESSDGPG
jgi:HEAT repeat protein